MQCGRNTNAMRGVMRFTCKWKKEEETGRVEIDIKLDEDFENFPYADRLDFLSDIIFQVTSLYNREVRNRKEKDND